MVNIYLFESKCRFVHFSFNDDGGAFVYMCVGYSRVHCQYDSGLARMGALLDRWDLIGPISRAAASNKQDLLPRRAGAGFTSARHFQLFYLHAPTILIRMDIHILHLT